MAQLSTIFLTKTHFLSKKFDDLTKKEGKKGKITKNKPETLPLFNLKLLSDRNV